MNVLILGIFKETGHHSMGASHVPLLALELLDFSCQFTPQQRPRCGRVARP